MLNIFSYVHAIKRLFLTIGLIVILAVLTTSSVFAVGNFSSVTSTLSSYAIGATNVTAAFTLTLGSSLPAGQFIEVYLGPIAQGDPSTMTVNFVSSTPAIEGLGFAAIGSDPTVNTIIQTGGLVYFKTIGATIPAGTAITFTIGKLTNYPYEQLVTAVRIRTVTIPDGAVIDGDTANSISDYSFLSNLYIGTLAFRGTVTNTGGTGVVGAYVDIHAAASSGGAPQPNGSQTDSAGRYLITTTNISVGATYFIDVSPPYNGGGNLLPPATYTTAYTGSPETKNFQFSAATKTITGTITYRGIGNPVVNASIHTFMMNGSGLVQALSNSSGVYTLSVTGGNWQVMPNANQGVSDWSYGQPPVTAKFDSDNSVENKTINFVVDRASSTVIGRLLKPDGFPVSQADNVQIGVLNQEGKGGSTQANNNGTFSVNVPAGTYNINIWAQPSSSFGIPAVSPVITVGDGQTGNAGDITLITKDSTITGFIRTADGVGVSNVQINAFLRQSNGASQTTTASDGSFTLSVAAGRWIVSPQFSYSDAYSNSTSPQEVSVSASSPATVNFVVQSTSVTINGVIQDSNGSPISVYGYAFAENPNGGMMGPSGMGGPIQRGSFSFKIPAGSYTVNAGLAPGSGYTSSTGTTVTATDNETKNIIVTVATNDATITGSILDSNGIGITSSGLSVFAMSKAGGYGSYQQGTVSGSTYTISVSAGEWTLGYFADPTATGYMSAPPDPSNKFTINSGDTVNKNITLISANATIAGKVTKPDGSNAVGAFVSLDNRETEDKEFFNGVPTDSSGNYTLKITAGTYKVRVSVPPNQGYLSPAEQNITVAADGTQTANFILRSSDASITGRITLNGSGLSSFVSAWADDGGFTQSTSNTNGDYTLSVTQNTTWHVIARYESGTTPYESSETAVVMSSSSAAANLALAAVSYTLPSSLTTTFDSTQPKIITLSDGTVLNIPASALATSGNVTITVNPKTSLPSKKGDKPIWYGYDFSATDSTGNAITSFNSTITITFPYTDAQLTAQGITASDLIPSYWDDTSGTWKKVSNITVDTTNKTVTITTDHFTDYALTANIAAASTPSTPSTVSTTSSSSNNNASPPGCNDQSPASAPKIFEVRRSKDSAKLYFVPASGSVNYYYISYSDKPNQDKYGVSFNQGYSSGALTYVINMLNPKTKYYFRIRAGNGCTPGPWSPWVSTTSSKSFVSTSTPTKTKLIKSKTVSINQPIQPTAQPVTEPTRVPTIAQSKPAVKQPVLQSLFSKLKSYFGL